MKKMKTGLVFIFTKDSLKLNSLMPNIRFCYQEASSSILIFSQKVPYFKVYCVQADFL